VTKVQVKANQTTTSPPALPPNRADEVFYEKPIVTLERLRKLEAAATTHVAALEKMLAQP